MNEQIRQMLKNYRQYDVKLRVLKSADVKTEEMEVFEALKEYINALDDESKQIIETIYVYRQSVREYARLKYLDRRTVTRRISKIIEQFCECYAEIKKKLSH